LDKRREDEKDICGNNLITNYTRRGETCIFVNPIFQVCTY
jgi:hypothetical protein